MGGVTDAVNSIPRRCVRVEVFPSVKLHEGYVYYQMSPATLRELGKTAPSCCRCSWIKQRGDDGPNHTLLYFAIEMHFRSTSIHISKNIWIHRLQKHLSSAFAFCPPPTLLKRSYALILAMFSEHVRLVQVTAADEQPRPDCLL